MTLKDLLARAKSLGIKGRHDMSKADLKSAVYAAELEDFAGPGVTVHENGVVEYNPQGEERQALNDDLRQTLETRARELGVANPEALDLLDLTTAVYQRAAVAQQTEFVEQMVDEAKPRRKGGGRGSNLNAPWQRKYYYLSVPDYQEAKTDGRLAKSPMQIQLMLKYMLEAGVTSPAKAATGTSVSQQAVAKRYLVTKIEPHVLFAYYRKKMDALGLTFAGYNMGGEGDEDAEAEVEQEDAEADEAEADEEGEGDE